MNSRELKGLEIAARCKITFRNGVWYVPSQSSNRSYKVILKPGADSCDCEDFSLTNEPCKHIYAARIVRERDFDGEPVEIDADTLPIKKTYKQDWIKYNQAQLTEASRFLVLLHDLCKGVEEPPQPKTGRRRTPMCEMVFASALKVFTTFSSRRYNFALEDAVAKGLVNKHHPVSVCAYLESELLTPVLHNLIVQSSLPLASVESILIPDSTGFSSCRFDRWYDEKYGKFRSGKIWVKAHAMIGAKTNIVTSVVIKDRDANDSPQLKELLEQTAKHFKVKEVPADKAYLSHENLALVESYGGTAYIPFKVNSTPGEPESLWEKMYLFFRYRREQFLEHYHKRSNAESTFSMVKAKFRDHVRSKTEIAMKNEVLAKFLCHNLVVIHQSHIELGIEPEFWVEDKPAVLSYAQAR